ncbi:MAG TPA: oxidoreductase [Acidimicrobiales bacterium]|jgi:NAD(P)-dependent dehydrogenase (short-subunit alcohol dehydrogenase family)|nr:oxidoreductase [Acidimicrobiales bacterium]
MTKTAWDADQIGDLTGKVALITGANSGIGFETARALADHGAHVIMACRNPEKARRAADVLENDLDRSSIELLALDLSDLVSVRQAAERVLAEQARMDLLINNAGVMGTPYRQTADGFELQMATNHLGHFAFTGLLLNRLLTTDRSRIVTVSSQFHRAGRIPFDDVAGESIRNTWLNYGTSKLANLLFMAELSRRLAASAESTISVAAHPGWTRSNLAGTGAAVGTGKLRAKFGRVAGRTFGQAAATGALPTLYAATAPGVANGQYFGPSHVVQLFGPPKLVRPSAAGRNEADAARLWEISESLTEVRYPIPASV